MRNIVIIVILLLGTSSYANPFKQEALHARIDSLEQSIVHHISTHDYANACILEDQLVVLKDSLNTQIHAELVNQLNDQFHIDGLQEEAHQNQFYLCFLFILAGVLIVLGILLIRFRTNISYKTSHLFDSMAGYNSLNEQLISFEHIKDYSSPEFQAFLNHGVSDASREMFESIERVMIDESVFTSPTLSREELATRLNTNRTYLIDIIKENTQQTFTDYVNTHRLNFARKFIEGDNQMSIQEIYIRSGFRSSATFYRLFTIKFGLTPSELRNFSAIDRKKNNGSKS